MTKQKKWADRSPEYKARHNKKKKPKAWADRSEAYKERRRQKDRKGGPRTITPKGDDSLFATGIFVALDGEGCDFGKWHSRKLRALMPKLDLMPSGKLKQNDALDPREYKFREHRLFLFAASTGHERRCADPQERLGLFDCLTVIFDARDAVVEGDGRPIFVWFSGGYDLAHMLLFDIGERDIRRLQSGRIIAWEFNGCKFKFARRTKRELTIWRQGGNISGWQSVTIWDVFGYFQCPFVKAVAEWLGEDHPDLQFVREMKAKRGEFEIEDISTLIEYNRAELRMLTALMGKVREAVSGLGIRLRRWDGAGSIAGMMLERARVKPHIGPPLIDRVQNAARCAYFGGRVECCQIGSTGLPVWRADMNSAFPWAVAELPSLGSGEWKSEGGEGPLHKTDFSLCRVSWEFPDAPWYPFLYRIGRRVFAPRCGEGWHFASECKSAISWCARFGGMISFHERLSHVNVERTRPFSFVHSHYDRRRNTESDGERKIIKLGLNAIWGKLSQQKGWRTDLGELETPPYHNFALAGYVTALVHARLIDLALQDPEAVIAFAVDGLLMSREPVAHQSGELGDWRIERHDGITHVQSGIYWLHDGAELRKLRGIGHGELTRERILEQWRGKSRQFELPVRRFLGIDASVMSSIAWRDRGSFVRFGEWFATDGRASGRTSVTQAEMRLLPRKLIATHPWTMYGNTLVDIPSEPYPTEWDETDIGEDVEV